MTLYRCIADGWGKKDSTDGLLIVEHLSNTYNIHTYLTGAVAGLVMINMHLTDHQWLKWSCEAAGGGEAHLTKPGWSKPHTHSTPN